MRMVRHCEPSWGPTTGPSSGSPASSATGRVGADLGHQADIDEGFAPGRPPRSPSGSRSSSRRYRELKRANEILKRAASFFGGGARPPTQVIVDFIDANRDEFGVEPICTVLRSQGGWPRAPTTQPRPGRRRPGPTGTPCWGPPCWRCGRHNYRVYGARKLWKAARRAGNDIGRDQMPG